MDFCSCANLDGVGFDLRLRWRDAAVGLRETAFYTPFALALGLGMGFLHAHAVLPGVGAIAGAWLFTFFFIAVPEELFFRGWLQNLLERRMGRWGSLLLTSVLFGLAHFNKRAAHFNWRYVLMAAIAGFFYGRAWLQRAARGHIGRDACLSGRHLVAVAAVGDAACGVRSGDSQGQRACSAPPDRER